MQQPKIGPVSKVIYFLLVASVISNHAFGQVFDWTEGYSDYSGGGTYSNIDKSGIGMTVSGFVDDRCWCGDNPRLYTGINNQIRSGHIHNYEFSFTRPVDVEFEISDVNRDSSNYSCYYDHLEFSDDPVLTILQDVEISADTVFPTTRFSGRILVSYTNVSSFQITHGNGDSCNPGYILISPLVFNHNDRLGPNTICADFIWTPTFADQELIISNNDANYPVFSVVNYLGQYIYADIKRDGRLTLDTSRMAAGNYVLNIYCNSDGMLRRKFTIVH